MKPYLLLVAAILLGFAIMSFNPTNKQYKTENITVKIGLNKLKSKIADLKKAAYLFQEGKNSVENMKLSIIETRNAWRIQVINATFS